MFLRYHLEVTYSGTTIYEKYFYSINRMVKFINGFNDDCIFYCHDIIADNFLDHDFLLELIKEFKDYD